MVFLSTRARCLIAATLLATSACAGNRSIPAAGMGADNASFVRVPDAGVDTTSVLKALTKNVTIGSTIDASPVIATAERETSQIRGGFSICSSFSAFKR